MILLLHHHFPRQWQGSKSPDTDSEDLSVGSAKCFSDVPALRGITWHANKHGLETIHQIRLDALFHQRMLFKLTRSAWACIGEWFRGKRRGLRLLFHIPLPSQVLEMQAHGERCVTAFCEPSQLFKIHIGNRDTLSFLMHDLEHMQKFVAVDESVYLQQVGFFHAMQSLCKGGTKSVKAWFQQIGADAGLEYNLRFWRDLEYVISDMNTSAVHSVSTLKAKWCLAECAATTGEGDCLKTQLTAIEIEGFDFRFSMLLDAWGIPDGETRTAFMKLCCDKLTPIEAANLGRWFEQAGAAATLDRSA